MPLTLKRNTTARVPIRLVTFESRSPTLGDGAHTRFELGLSPRERRDAEFAALLHDVGKVRIPNSIYRVAASFA